MFCVRCLFIKNSGGCDLVVMFVCLSETVKGGVWAGVFCVQCLFIKNSGGCDLGVMFVCLSETVKGLSLIHI